MNMEVIDLARANGVVLLCLPPQQTHHVNSTLDLGGNRVAK